MDYKCEWDLPMYCDLREVQQFDEKKAGRTGDERDKEDDGAAGDRCAEPYGDQKGLEMLPDVGFFKKLK